MESQKIANLLNEPENKSATRKWYIIIDKNNGQYGEGDGDNDSTIKLKQKLLNPSFVITLMHIF